MLEHDWQGIDPGRPVGGRRSACGTQETKAALARWKQCKAAGLRPSGAALAEERLQCAPDRMVMRTLTEPQRRPSAKRLLAGAPCLPSLPPARTPAWRPSSEGAAGPRCSPPRRARAPVLSQPTADCALATAHPVATSAPLASSQARVPLASSPFLGAAFGPPGAAAEPSPFVGAAAAPAPPSPFAASGGSAAPFGAPWAKFRPFDRWVSLTAPVPRCLPPWRPRLRPPL